MYKYFFLPPELAQNVKAMNEILSSAFAQHATEREEMKICQRNCHNQRQFAAFHYCAPISLSIYHVVIVCACVCVVL
jgi:hypothetical protein